MKPRSFASLVGLCLALGAASLPGMAAPSAPLLAAAHPVRPINPLTLKHAPKKHPANWNKMTPKQKQQWIQVNSFSYGAGHGTAATGAGAAAKTP